MSNDCGSCIEAVRYVFAHAEEPLTKLDVWERVNYGWLLNTVKENLRVLETRGEIKCVGIGGPNKRAKIYRRKESE